MRDPENQPRPPQDGGYKPLTPQAAVRDIRSLCKQQVYFKDLKIKINDLLPECLLCAIILQSMIYRRAAFGSIISWGLLSTLHSLFAQWKIFTEKLDGETETMELHKRWKMLRSGYARHIQRICSNCEPFAASRIRMKRVSKTLRKQEAKARRRSLKKLTASAKIKQRLIARRK